MKMLGLMLAVVLLTITPLRAADIEFTGEVITIPMRHSTGHVAVEVMINGKGPYLFQVDTYASIDACIDDDLAKELKLEKTGTTQNSDGHTTRQRDIVRIDQLKLADATFTDLRTLVDDYDWIKHPDGRTVQGLLGFPAFRQVLLTFDYPKSQLVLARGELVRDAPGVLAYQGRNAPNIHLNIGDKRFRFGMDTGCGSFLLMPLDRAKHIALSGELVKAGQARTAYSAVDIMSGWLEKSLDIAGYASGPTRVSFVDGGSSSLMGYGLFRGFAVTFDQANRLVRFKRPPLPPHVELTDQQTKQWVGLYAERPHEYAIEQDGERLYFVEKRRPREEIVLLSDTEAILRFTRARLKLILDGNQVKALEIQAPYVQRSLTLPRAK